MAVDEAERGMDEAEGEGDIRHAEVTTPHSAMKAASTGRPLTDEAENLALQWFLSSEPEDLGAEQDGTYTFEINVALAPEKNFIPWTIQVVGSDKIRELRRAGESRNQRRQRQMGVVPEVESGEFELRLIVEGTVNPDLHAVAAMPKVAQRLEAMGVPSRHPDPNFRAMQALKLRFGHKPLLIEQIGREILNFGGGDPEDVRDLSANRESSAGKP